MTFATSNDLDYLAARLHARRSRMAEAERLDALCRIRNLPEFGHFVCPGPQFAGAKDFQQRLLQDLAWEIYGSLKHLDGSARRFIERLLARFQIENLKVLLRGFTNRIQLAELQPHLVDLPGNLALDATTLMAAKSLEEFVGQIPSNILGKQFPAIVKDRNLTPNLFMLESALDTGYLHELLDRTSGLSDTERETVKPLVLQEANFYQFALVLRGRFHFNLEPESLWRLWIQQSWVSQEWFQRLLSAPDIATASSLGVGVVIDTMPVSRGSDGEKGGIDMGSIELLAWKRFLRLANIAFRRSHMGVGAVAGYFGVRRVEIANFITLSEGIRLGIDERELRARLISRCEMEVAHV